MVEQANKIIKSEDNFYITTYGRYYYADAIAKKNNKIFTVKTILIGLLINLCVITAPGEASFAQNNTTQTNTT